MGNDNPYTVGNTITLQLDAPYHQTIEATIAKVFEPFTLSVAMVIFPDSPSLDLKGHMVLKLYDRRSATQLRRDEKADPWCVDIERQYQQFVMDGGACELISRLNSDEDIPDEEMDAWDAAQIETSLHDQMRDFYYCESEIYNALKDIQGKRIPQVYASVTVPVSSRDASVSTYMDVPGILMEYIDGFPLTDIADNAPREKWQFLCDEAIRIIQVISERGILNEDVKTRSFIVQDVEGKGRVTMIDFALCKFRREYKDEEEWRKWKAIQDEEGAVGYVMQKRLKGGFVYTRSAMATQLDDDFMTADSVFSCE